MNKKRNKLARRFIIQRARRLEFKIHRDVVTGNFQAYTQDRELLKGITHAYHIK